nr:hypothetical protein [Curtobacterium sp. MCBD17_032]
MITAERQAVSGIVGALQRLCADVGCFDDRLCVEVAHGATSAVALQDRERESRLIRPCLASLPSSLDVIYDKFELVVLIGLGLRRQRIVI